MRLHRHSLANILVVGGSEARRVAVARTFHEASRLRGGPFVAVDCARDEPRVLAALQAWLVCDDAPPTGPTLVTCERGTLFLDEVGMLSRPAQRMLLMLARRIEGATSDSPMEYGPLRLAVGSTDDLARLVDEDRFSGDLHDCLDKIRVDLGRESRRGAA